MNDRHPLRDFHDGPGIHAHRKAEYTNATAPLPDSKINRGTYRLTEEYIYELLDLFPILQLFQNHQLLVGNEIKHIVKV